VPSTARDPAAARVRAAASRLVGRVEHWTAKRWSMPAAAVDGERGAPATTRAEVVHALVQRLADIVAGHEGRPAQAVPRLDNDLALPDQLRVMVADLQAVGAANDVLRDTAADIDATAARL
jgi:hypothetical protein